MERIIYPSWLEGQKGPYAASRKFLPHQLKYANAVAAFEECEMKRTQEVTKEQQEKINLLLKKEKKKFVAYEVIGYIALILNFATFVPILIQAIQDKPVAQKNLSLIWIGFIDQLFWLVYAIFYRSAPILILSLLLIPLFITVLVLIY